MVDIDRLYNKWERYYGEKIIVLKYPSLRGLYDWFLREAKKRGIDPEKIDFESVVGAREDYEENKARLLVELDATTEEKEVVAEHQAEEAREFAERIAEEAGILDWYKEKFAELKIEAERGKKRLERVRKLERELARLKEVPEQLFVPEVSEFYLEDLKKIFMALPGATPEGWRAWVAAYAEKIKEEWKRVIPATFEADMRAFIAKAPPPPPVVFPPPKPPEVKPPKPPRVPRVPVAPPRPIEEIAVSPITGKPLDRVVHIRIITPEISQEPIPWHEMTQEQRRHYELKNQVPTREVTIERIEMVEVPSGMLFFFDRADGRYYEIVDYTLVPISYDKIIERVRRVMRPIIPRRGPAAPLSILREAQLHVREVETDPEFQKYVAEEVGLEWATYLRQDAWTKKAIRDEFIKVRGPM